MQGKKIGLVLAAGMMLFAMGGCSAGEEDVTVSATAAPTQEAAPTPEITEEPSATQNEEDSLVPQDVDVIQAETTLAMIGTITNVDPEEKKVGIAEGEVETNTQDSLEAIISASTLLIDAASGRSLQLEELKEDSPVYAFVSPMMTRSIPPQSNAKALILNISESTGGVANYIYALQVEDTASGDLRVLNQNADLYVTIPADVKLEKLDSTEEVSRDDIKAGSVLIAWYDAVAESYPAQATATRVVVCPSPDEAVTELTAEETAQSAAATAASGSGQAGAPAATKAPATVAPASAEPSAAEANPAEASEGEEEMAVGNY